MNDNPNPNYRPDVVCLQKVISLEEIQKANEIIVNKQQDYLDLEDSPAPNAKKTSTIKFIQDKSLSIVSSSNTMQQFSTIAVSNFKPTGPVVFKNAKSDTLPVGSK